MSSETIQLTLSDLKKHVGPIMAWVNIFECDGEYLRVVKSDLLKKIGGDVPHEDGGLADSTPIRGARIEGGVFYID